MPNIIVQQSIESTTGLPKDAFENIWHFTDDLALDRLSVVNTAFAKIWDFLKTPPAGGGVAAVSQFYSPSLADTITLKAYDFADATPRPEIGVATFTFTPLASNGMPEEVALCLSYYTDRNLPSKRGRLYLGPWGVNAMSTGVPSRPTMAGGLGKSIQFGGARLVVAGGPVATPTFVTNTVSGSAISVTTAWALYSPKLGTFAALHNGWVDDEWDSQRRRRVEASTRLTF